jgi:fructose-bisphosphate aldolase class II
VHREFFLEHPEKFDLRDPGKIYISEYAKFIAQKNIYLGSAGELEDVRKFIKE